MAAGNKLGTRIKRARERAQLTQQQLASAVGVDRKTVDNWENGRTTPRSSIGAIEDYLGIDLDEDGIPGLPPLVAANARQPGVMEIWEIPDEVIPASARLALIRRLLQLIPDPPSTRPDPAAAG